MTRGGERVPSGNVRLRLPRSLHVAAKEAAERDGVSLNTFLVAAVAEKVGSEKGVDNVSARERP